MNTRILIPSVIVAVLTLIIVVIVYSKEVNPPVYEFSTDPAAEVAALQAGGIGNVYHVAFTGSMRPFLDGGEYVVIDRNFESAQRGQIAIYRYKSSSVPYIHRLAQKDSLGWIAGGDHNKSYENWERVTKDNFIGVVVGVYRVKKETK